MLRACAAFDAHELGEQGSRLWIGVVTAFSRSPYRGERVDNYSNGRGQKQLIDKIETRLADRLKEAIVVRVFEGGTPPANLQHS